MLSAENLSLFRNHKLIFSKINFVLAPGKALVIVGKNGSGKTSLLKIIAGLITPDSGTISWCGQDVTELREDFNADIQFLGHHNFFKPELTIIENLKFYARLSGDETLIEPALKFFELTDYAQLKFSTLSAGLKQRALLCKLIVCPTAIWLLDEPSINLDARGRELLIGLIDTKIKNGELAIITTHEKEFYALGECLFL